MKRHSSVLIPSPGNIIVDDDETSLRVSKSCPRICIIQRPQVFGTRLAGVGHVCGQDRTNSAITSSPSLFAFVPSSLTIHSPPLFKLALYINHMSYPSIAQRFRHVMGRAFRESAQALDRVALRLSNVATTQFDLYDDPMPFEDHLSRHRHQFPTLWSGRPIVHPDAAYLAPCSTLIGSVRIGAGSSVWYGAVLRADECANANNLEGPWELPEHRISHHAGGGVFIGENSNIQDGCVVTAKENHCRIGNGVTVGHLAQIHSATVEDFCLIGMASIVQAGAVIEFEAFVAAGAVVRRDQVVGAGELWVGNPARKLRDLSAAERAKLHYQSSEYVTVATGQKGVMELGGNIAESMLEQLLRIEAGTEDSLAVADEKGEATVEQLETSKVDGVP
jgi:gamma-carbonic anhydrase